MGERQQDQARLLAQFWFQLAVKGSASSFRSHALEA